MFTKYHIKYEKSEKHLMIGGMDISLVPSFIKEINTLNTQIKSLYSHGDIVVLSGSGALLYYLHTLGYTDLINELIEPSDVDFLLLTDEPNATITVPFIGDHKRKQVTHEKSATFENDWATHLKFKSFDLTIPRNSIIYNQVGTINLLSLSQLKSYYLDDLDTRPNDNKKIQIITAIQSRLNTNPKQKNISPEQTFRISKTKSKQIPITYEPQMTVNQKLFSDSPDTPERGTNLFGNFDSPPNKSIGKTLFPDSP
jgi:hypothetical protein